MLNLSQLSFSSCFSTLMKFFITVFTADGSDVGSEMKGRKSIYITGNSELEITNCMLHHLIRLMHS